MAHALLCLICTLYPQQTHLGDEELRNICYDRIVVLEDANEFERAAAIARMAKKKFARDPRFVVKHRELLVKSLRSIPQLTNDLQPSQRCVAQYSIGSIKGLDTSLKVKKLNKMADTILQQIDPNSVSTDQLIVIPYPANDSLVVTATRENHDKVQELLGKDAFKPWRK